MHKILLVIFILVFFLFPKSEVLAKPNPFLECTDKDLIKEKPIIINRADPQTCPPQAHCYKGAIVVGLQQYYCYELDPAKAGPAAAVPCTDKTCTSARGQPCTEGITSGSGIRTAIGCVPTEPKALVEGLLKYGTFAAGGIAFLIMIIASLQLITAEGNPETIKGAQEKFYSAIIGLLLIIFAVLLMQVIGVDILGLPGFGNK